MRDDLPNPNVEIRSWKQTPIPNSQMAKTGTAVVSNFGFSPFGFVSDFGLRISDFACGRPLQIFRVALDFHGSIRVPEPPFQSQEGTGRFHGRAGNIERLALAGMDSSQRFTHVDGRGVGSGAADAARQESVRLFHAAGEKNRTGLIRRAVGLARASSSSGQRTAEKTA